ncbi:MAG: glycosyltransferase family 2 protein [Oscillospiraceae bacterium]|jgi:glycosyltransferase involved in cell wall biosynthesis|nr:glycosyltransferase family 2 protein [Oscillospiraceae bacterium]
MKYIFSVIIPVYNVEKYIETAIESVINQTVGFENIQLILINDGSTDNSALICEKFQQKHSNICYINKEHSGVSDTRNVGIEVAYSEYTAFLDGDDKFSPDLLKICFEFLELNKDKIDFTQVNTVFFDSKKGQHPLCINQKTRIISLNDKNIVPLRVVFFKTKVLKNYKFDKNVALAEDFKLFFEIAAEKYFFGYINEATYFYRRRAEKSSAINNQRKNIETFKRVFKVYKYLFDFFLAKFRKIPYYIERVVCYDLQWYKGDYSEELKNTPEYTTAWDAFLYCLQYIDDEIIFSQRNLSFSQKIGWLKLKYGEIKLFENKIKPFCTFGEFTLETFGSDVMIQSCENGFKGIFSAVCENIKLIAKYNENCFFSTIKRNNIFYMGKAIYYENEFYFKIDFIVEDCIRFFYETPAKRLVPVVLKFEESNGNIKKTNKSNTLKVRRKN